MNGFRKIAALCSFIFISNLALGMPSPNAEMHKHLTQLNHEFDQFKKREKTVTDEQKEAFQKSVSSIESKLEIANQYIGQLTEKSNKDEKEKTRKILAGIEKELDQAESHFSEKDLGLGSLLGF